MGPDTIWVLIPLIAIGGGIVKSVLSSQERRLELRLQAQQGQNAAVAEQIESLRREVAALRDTGTQFDMSLEQTVQRLEDRLGRVETKAAIPATPVPTDYQQNGTR